MVKCAYNLSMWILCSYPAEPRPNIMCLPILGKSSFITGIKFWNKKTRHLKKGMKMCPSPVIEY